MKPFVILEPCHERWDAMREANGARHCASCDKHVVDVAGLTEGEARGMMTLTGGDMCVRQTVRRGGLLALAGAVAGALVTAPAAAASPEPPQKVEQPLTHIERRPMMGRVAIRVPEVDEFEIGFEKNSAKLSQAMERQVINAAAALKRSSWLKHVVVEGHVTNDELGKASDSLALDRANAVRALMVKQGIDWARLSIVAVPAADSARRVTFVIEPSR